VAALSCAAFSLRQPSFTLNACWYKDMADETRIHETLRHGIIQTSLLGHVSTTIRKTFHVQERYDTPSRRRYGGIATKPPPACHDSMHFLCLHITAHGDEFESRYPHDSPFRVSKRNEQTYHVTNKKYGLWKTFISCSRQQRPRILSSGGIDRSYLLHIPRGYKDTIEQPLVLNFHGHGSNALQQQYYTGFSHLADAYDFIVAYPQGAIGLDHRTGWDTGSRRNPHTNDVLFVSNLLTHLQESWCINPDRIYATGFSNGGGMTYVLACKMADRFAAFASVSGSYPPVPGGCNPARPVPYMELHGTGDKVVPYNGSPAKGYPPVTQWLQQWAQRDGCNSQPVIFFHQANVTGEKWVGCRDNVTIIHYTIGGMGHMWPRHLIIRTHNSAIAFDATSLIWSFFQSYRLPTGSTRT
jgi:polyhydroxybutyrate depolymerase